MDDNIQATILAVDDEPSNLNIIAGYLKSMPIKLLVANSGEKALSVTQSTLPDMILMDIRMPGLSGIEVCRQLKSSPKTADIPVIFLTASDRDVSESFAAGGVDYLVKPVKSEELVARVNTHLKIRKLVKSLAQANSLLEGVNESLEAKVQERTRELVALNRNLRREVDERRRLQDKITYLSEHDFITRMLNRNAMESELDIALDSVGESISTRHYLLFIDLDQFKVINDTCGHIAGDELLRQVADTLRAVTDKQDICARMGGDEFAILFSSEDMGLAIAKTRTVKSALEQQEFTWQEEQFQHTVSVALVEIDTSIDSVSHLLSIAERTCYYSKIKGGGEISVFNASRELIEKSQKQAKQVPIIRQAIADNRLELHAQRIISLHDASEQKAEILVRMKNDDGSLKLPGQFIPVAERFHLIDSIDRWVLSHLCQWLAENPTDASFSVNLSGDFIAKDSACDFITNLLRQYRVPKGQLCFEITETSAIANIDTTVRFVNTLHQTGCEFALDDFGTGTSSYEYLKKLAVDYVKIDGMFVRDIDKDPINRKMVESIAAIASAKGIKVVAECVENDSAKAILSEIGVDYIQGFCEHRPEPLPGLYSKFKSLQEHA